MGLRYRKSINLGGGFRVNFSKSGIGYSWGTKGYRVTKKAGGGVRKTYSIPGTGLSWVDEKGRGRKNNPAIKQGNGNMPVYSDGEVLYQAEDANVAQFVTDNSQEFIEAIKKFTTIRGLLKWGSIISFVLMFSVPVLLVAFAVCYFGFLYVVFKKKIPLEYECDDYGNRRIQMLDQAMNSLMNNRMVWQIRTIQANNNVKVNAGAANSVARTPVKFQKKKPFFLKTDATCYHIKLLKDDVFILPDRLIVKGRKGWGVVEYEELDVQVGSTVFIENGIPPKDAAVIGHTWQYVNKNGSPDKRYSNNRQLPKCNYGTIGFRSATGLNVLLYISNRQQALDFKMTVAQMTSEAKQMREIMEREMEQIGQNQPVPVQETMQPIIHRSTETVVEVNERETATEGFDSFVLQDANSQEREIQQKLWDALTENNLLNGSVCRRRADGAIDFIHKGIIVGSFCFRSGSSWLVFPMGNSGKTKQIDGDVNELTQHVSKWIRYILNYA